MVGSTHITTDVSFRRDPQTSQSFALVGCGAVGGIVDLEHAEVSSLALKRPGGFHRAHYSSLRLDPIDF